VARRSGKVAQNPATKWHKWHKWHTKWNTENCMHINGLSVVCATVPLYLG